MTEEPCDREEPSNREEECDLEEEPCDRKESCDRNGPSGAACCSASRAAAQTGASGRAHEWGGSGWPAGAGSEPGGQRKINAEAKWGESVTKYVEAQVQMRVQCGFRGACGIKRDQAAQGALGGGLQRPGWSCSGPAAALPGHCQHSRAPPHPYARRWRPPGVRPAAVCGVCSAWCRLVCGVFRTAGCRGDGSKAGLWWKAVAALA